MTVEKIVPIIPHRIHGQRAFVHCMLAICAFLAIEVVLSGFTEAAEEDQLDRIVFAYSSNPIIYYSPIASRTQVFNKGLPSASLHHSIESAKEISSSAEYVVSKRSYLESDSTSISSSSIGMKIDETVTEGKVHIGAFQADASQNGAGQRNGSKVANAWKDPLLEMEEEYIGTFHISKNMTINSSDIIHQGVQSWMDYDIVYLSFNPSKPISISADDVFKCFNCGRNQ